MIKFDCTKVSGKIDSITITKQITRGYITTISIDGHKIPNIQIDPTFYESLNTGDEVTLYTICKNSNNKAKNMGVLYGYEKNNGQSFFATKYRWQVPAMMAFYGAMAFCAVFAVGWPVTLYLIANLNLTNGEGRPPITGYALVEASLAGGFFLWGAWKMLTSTADPQSWGSIAPSALSSRFSKLHK